MFSKYYQSELTYLRELGREFVGGVKSLFRHSDLRLELILTCDDDRMAYRPHAPVLLRRTLLRVPAEPAQFNSDPLSSPKFLSSCEGWRLQDSNT